MDTTVADPAPAHALAEQGSQRNTQPRKAMVKILQDLEPAERCPLQIHSFHSGVHHHAQSGSVTSLRIAR
jgi:hypothetical protein